MHHNLELLWIVSYVFATALVLAVCILLLRHGRSFRWVLLTGAVAFTASSTFTVIRLTLDSLGAHRHMERWLEWTKYNGMVHTWGLILFLIGIFLRTVRQTGESARLAELETILQDQQHPVPPRDRP
jgi:hypothetical protein